MRLDDKVALITGAGQGMGLGIARRLAMEGHHVLINDLLEDRAADAATDIVAQGGQVQSKYTPSMPHHSNRESTIVWLLVKHLYVI